MEDKYLRKISIDKDDFVSLILGNLEVNESIGEMIARLSKSNLSKIETYTHRRPPIDFTKVR